MSGQRIQYAPEPVASVSVQQQHQVMLQQHQRRANIDDMPTQEEFERDLLAAITSEENRNEFELHTREAIARALGDLEEHPSEMSRGTGRDFTYEHPVLAVALHAYKQAKRRRLSDRLLHRWLAVGVSALLARRDLDFIELAGLTPRVPIDLESESDSEDIVRIAVLGDAGYLCPAQQCVIDLMKGQCGSESYPLLVHLGDTYFAGSKEEMLDNLLEPLFRAPAIRRASLCGNHDLYFGAEPYIKAIRILQQPGRYFAVRAAGWTVACLDTSLASATVLRQDGLLDQGQLDWLERTAREVKGRRLILMGHHPPISDWERSSDEMRKQIHQAIMDKVALWYWGHEHRLAAYGSAEFHWKGALVGNGAFQEPVGGPTRKPTRVEWFPEGKCTCYEESFLHRDEWPHGFLELTLRPGSVEERYVFENGDVYTRSIA